MALLNAVMRAFLNFLAFTAWMIASCSGDGVHPFGIPVRDQQQIVVLPVPANALIEMLDMIISLMLRSNLFYKPTRTAPSYLLSAVK